MVRTPQTNTDEAVASVDTAGGRVAASSRATTRKSARVASANKASEANIGEGEEKSGEAAPQNRQPDAGDAADVSADAAGASGSATEQADGQPAPSPEPRKFPATRPTRQTIANLDETLYENGV